MSGKENKVNVKC